MPTTRFAPTAVTRMSPTRFVARWLTWTSTVSERFERFATEMPRAAVGVLRSQVEGAGGAPSDDVGNHRGESGRRMPHIRRSPTACPAERAPTLVFGRH